jgi:hypothetical protein
VKEWPVSSWNEKSGGNLQEMVVRIAEKIRILVGSFHTFFNKAFELYHAQKTGTGTIGQTCRLLVSSLQ